jgi:hypothetical protein
VKITVANLGEGEDAAVMAWSREVIEFAIYSARRHKITLVGGETIEGEHKLPSGPLTSLPEEPPTTN